MTSSKNEAVIWRYVLRYDTGLAPHIAEGICSLVVCKPGIRRHAKPGEWIIGFAPAAESNGQPVVKYLMKVAANPSFEDYCRKYMGTRRDAIYHYGPHSDGKWVDNGFKDHDPSEGDHGTRDKSGKHALTATEFFHFGFAPRSLTFELMPYCDKRGLDAEQIARELHHRTQGQAKYCSLEAHNVFLEWVECLSSTTVKAGSPAQRAGNRGCAPKPRKGC